MHEHACYLRVEDAAFTREGSGRRRRCPPYGWCMIVPKVLIGAGGWAYFHGSESDPLSEYSRAFDFVEVNSTFYEIPSVQVARNWRKRVRGKFEFSVRANHSMLSNQQRMNLTSRLAQHVEILNALRAEFIVLTPPNSYGWIERFWKVAGALRREGFTPVLDCRIFKLSPCMLREMEKSGYVQAVDLSLRKPDVESKTVYARLFGVPAGNIHQFTDDELKRVHKKATAAKFEKSILAFHGVKMYSDAARLKAYYQSGVFPSVTSSVGFESLAEVLSEDMRFPASKADLLLFQSWKLIDLSATKRVQAGELLSKLPERVFSSPLEVIEALRA